MGAKCRNRENHEPAKSFCMSAFESPLAADMGADQAVCKLARIAQTIIDLCKEFAQMAHPTAFDGGRGARS